MVKFISSFFSVILTTFVIGLPQAKAQVIVGGVLEENTVYHAELNPYIVTESVEIPEGLTLTIEPGVQILFMVRTSIVVNGGVLKASGTQEYPIQFASRTSNEKWNGLNFKGSRALFDDEGNYEGGNIVKFASIQQSTSAFVLSDSASVLIDSTSIFNCEYGITMQSGSSMYFKNSSIEQCSFGVSIKNSANNVIRNCTINQCDIGIFFPSNNQSKYNRIFNNVITNNTIIGIFFSIGQSSMQFNRVYGNTLNNNDIGLYIGNGGLNDQGLNSFYNNIIKFNNIGVKLSQNSDTLKANTIESNATGVLLVKASNNYIHSNSIVNSSETGILLTDGSSNNFISENRLCINNQGVKVTKKDMNLSVNNLFTYNLIGRSVHEAFLFESGPQLPLKFNSFYGSNDENVFVNHNSTDILATENWFGTTDTLLIDRMIYDHYDSTIYGKVIYKPFLNYPDPLSPVSMPSVVIKRLVNNVVRVEWNKNPETDLAGYKVYYGGGSENNFQHMIDVGIDTLVVIPDVLLADTIAVSAYDNDADGFADLLEGHESTVNYAVAGPWAGNDTLICYGEEYLTTSATTLYHENLFWSSSGDGTFTDLTELSTRYIPGEDDLSVGSVKLTLKQQVENMEITDELLLQIHYLPFVNAGADTVIFEHGAYNTTSAEAGNFEYVNWSSMGDGVFEDSLSLHTSYFPGESDIHQGYVNLILRLNSYCGDLSDTITISIVPTFRISGRVYHDDTPVNASVVVAVNTDNENPRAISTATTDTEGLFEFMDLPAGGYYLYAVINPESTTQWMPCYYASCCFWQDAYMLPLNADVYDVDIRLIPMNTTLPAGEGVISGSFFYMERSQDKDSVYNTPWFKSGNGPSFAVADNPAPNHTVMLMNSEQNRIFDWALTDADGAFSFNNLPFGSYRLWGEKAGFSNASSPVITLTPQNSQVDGVRLNILPKRIEISVPQVFAYSKEAVVYPNPANDRIWINNEVMNSVNHLEFTLSDALGQIVLLHSIDVLSGEGYSGIDIQNLMPGVYVFRISADNGYSYSSKLVITR